MSPITGMGEINRNGVDAAIALLLALSRHASAVRSSELASEAGLPRSSFHRIAQALAAGGLVTLSRGSIAPGPLADRLALTRAAGLATRAEPSRTPQSQTSRRTAPAREPIALAAPLPRRHNGRYRIGFSNASMGNAWRVALVHAIERATARFGDSIGRLVVRHAGDDAAKQVADLNALIDEGVDGLIVSVEDPALAAEPLRRAYQNGIPVVLVDRGVADGVPHQSFVWADDEAIGRIHALWLCERLGGEGAILMLPGRRGALPAQRRLAAAKAVIAQYSGIEILRIAWTDWHREPARAVVAEAIAAHGRRIAGVWCDSGLQGVGSLEAFIAAGRKPGDIPPHTGGDLNLAYKLAIRHRVPLAAMDYPPAMGAVAVETLHATLRGDWVPRSVQVASEVILTRGHTTRSVKPTLLAEAHVRWDLPDDLVLASGLGPAYNPRSFRIHYPGNRYNRSAARTGEAV